MECFAVKESQHKGADDQQGQHLVEFASLASPYAYDMPQEERCGGEHTESNIVLAATKACHSKHHQRCLIPLRGTFADAQRYGLADTIQ